MNDDFGLMKAQEVEVRFNEDAERSGNYVLRGSNNFGLFLTVREKSTEVHFVPWAAIRHVSVSTTVFSDYDNAIVAFK